MTVSALQVITYSGGRVYDDLNEEQKGRVSFTSNFRAGDASLQIISLQSSDAGNYICKVKKAGQYEWVRITLKVVGKIILLFFQRGKKKSLGSFPEERFISVEYKYTQTSHDQVSLSSSISTFAFFWQRTAHRKSPESCFEVSVHTCKII